MNFQKIKESDEVELPLLLRSRWVSLVVDEERHTNQAMKLMTPVYMALHAHGFHHIDARCQTIWALYMRGLRTAVLGKGDPKDCLASVRAALQLITESKK